MSNVMIHSPHNQNSSKPQVKQSINMEASLESKALIKDDDKPTTDDASDVKRQSRLFSMQGRLANVIPREIDVFGFSLQPKHFLIVLALVTAMLGSGGSK